jgi:chemotaxis protein MotB
MRLPKLLLTLAVILTISLICGCANDLQIQNERQRKTLADLESKLRAETLKTDQVERQLADANSECRVKTDSLEQTVAALEKDLEQKKGMLGSLGNQLLYGAALPVELATKLEDFAKGTGGMVTFDSSRGLIKFQSDLLFDKGSDEVSAAGVNAIKSLCPILNSEEGKKFDVIIAGHTDDMPISRPETKAKHPTNWHLSVDRAISVLNVMSRNEVAPERVSVRGFGEYRPLEPNAAGQKGNPKNRRVEIYIVPKGV